MTGRTANQSAQPETDAYENAGEGGEKPQGPPPSPPTEGEAKKKSSADWTLPPHLRESLPLNPKGGRAPKPPASTAAS
jgi:hypothetical protein